MWCKLSWPMGRATLVAVLICFPGLIFASPEKLGLGDAELRGKATLRILGLPLYEASLYTVGGQKFDWSRDFGLRLVYQRSFSERDLVDSTLREMARIGPPVQIGSALEKCFDDVTKGDSYLAVTSGQDSLRFARNGQLTCTLSHPNIKRRFMEIFLGQDTRSKSFTRKLRGE